MRTCSLCGEQDPNLFYQSTNRNRCKTCFIKTATNLHLKGRERDILSKLERKKCLMCDLQVTRDNFHHFEWNHREPCNKQYTVSTLKQCSETTYKNEIAKCDLLCLFHHADITRHQVENKLLDYSRKK